VLAKETSLKRCWTRTCYTNLFPICSRFCTSHCKQMVLSLCLGICLNRQMNVIRNSTLSQIFWDDSTPKIFENVSNSWPSEILLRCFLIFRCFLMRGPSKLPIFQLRRSDFVSQSDFVLQTLAGVNIVMCLLSFFLFRYLKQIKTVTPLCTTVWIHQSLHVLCGYYQ